MRNKLKDYLDIPDCEDESWVPFCQIDDSKDSYEVRIVAIFATNKILSYLKTSDTFHFDATYRLNWNGYLIFICDVTNQTRKFFPIICRSLYSWECRELENCFPVYSFLLWRKSLQVFMGDGVKAITQAWSEVSFFTYRATFGIESTFQYIMLTQFTFILKFKFNHSTKSSLTSF